MENFYIQNPFASVLFCALAYRANITWAAELALRLVLQITVDQLGGDLPGRFINQMGEGGFRYLIDNGVRYADAHHAHANTETIVVTLCLPPVQTQRLMA